MKLYRYQKFLESSEDIHSICVKYGVKAIDGTRLNSYVLEEIIFLELGLTPPKIKYIEGYEIV